MNAASGNSAADGRMPKLSGETVSQSLVSPPSSDACSRACVYALGANADTLVEWMRVTVEHGMPNYPAFSRDACFDPIRHTPVFKEFMSNLKPTWEGYERALR